MTQLCSRLRPRLGRASGFLIRFSKLAQFKLHSVTAPYNYLHMYTYVVLSCIAHTCIGCNFTATSLLPVNKIGAMIKIWPSHDHLIIANHETIFSFIV